MRWRDVAPAGLAAAAGATTLDGSSPSRILSLSLVVSVISSTSEATSNSLVQTITHTTAVNRSAGSHPPVIFPRIRHIFTSLNTKTITELCILRSNQPPGIIAEVAVVTRTISFCSTLFVIFVLIPSYPS